MESKTKRKIAKILRRTGYVLAVIGIILISIAGVMASPYSEIREIGQTMESPEQIHNYLWQTNNYIFNYYRQPLNEYWTTRKGDCTEVARVEYIMFKSIGYKARISHGYLNGSKHDYTEYYQYNKWVSPNPTIQRQGRGIW